jgi:MinD superfamily P-loop ATPase
VIASLAGADFAVIVTEPTMSGLHDLSRVADLTKQLGIAAAVCINKYDINKNQSAQIEVESSAKGISVIGRIEYDKAFTDAQIEGVSMVEYTQSSTTEQIKDAWSKVIEASGLKSQR